MGFLVRCSLEVEAKSNNCCKVAFIRKSLDRGFHEKIQHLPQGVGKTVNVLPRFTITTVRSLALSNLP